MSEAATRSKRKAGATVKVTPDDFRRVLAWLGSTQLVERERTMRDVNLCALAGQNLHQLGPAGVAKSHALSEFAACISGARYFEKQINAGLPPDSVLGAYDMPRFAATGEFVRNVEHHAPNADISFIDEIFRGNGPMLDALLPYMNSAKRRAELNGGMVPVPTLFVVTASNHMPDRDDGQRQALVDRITMMQYIDDIRTDDNFVAVMRQHGARLTSAGDVESTRETIAKEQLQQAQAEVRAVTLTPEFENAATKLRKDAEANGLRASTRRWLELYVVCRANAWMNGRKHLVPEDLAVCEPGLWRDPNDRAKAHELVIKFHGRFEREANERRKEAAKPLAQLAEVRPVIENTPPHQELDVEVWKKVNNASRALGSVRERVCKSLAEAAKEQMDASGLRELEAELRATQEWLAANKMPTGWTPDE